MVCNFDNNMYSTNTYVNAHLHMWTVPEKRGLNEANMNIEIYTYSFSSQ